MPPCHEAAAPSFLCTSVSDRSKRTYLFSLTFPCDNAEPGYTHTINSKTENNCRSLSSTLEYLASQNSLLQNAENVKSIIHKTDSIIPMSGPPLPPHTDKGGGCRHGTPSPHQPHNTTYTTSKHHQHPYHTFLRLRRVQ